MKTADGTSESPLGAWLSQLKRLVRSLAKAEKHRARQPAAAEAALDETLRGIEGMDWPSLRAVLQRERDDLRARHDIELRTRREDLLKAAKAAGVPTDTGGRADRIGILRVEYEGVQAIVKLGGVRVEILKETDGRRLFERLQKRLEALAKEPFSREDYFRLLQAAYGSCRRASPTEEFVLWRDLYRELVFERARKNEKFRRSPDPKNLDSYPSFQFIYDLARFLRGGVSVGGERLQTQTPSMREGKDTVFIPNLEHPLSAENSVARLAIKAT